MPRKLTVTRIAAMRSRQLTSRGVELFRKAATADGADRSGLTHLTYAVMANYAVDAALTVALANTLFFAAASAESTGKVLLYLLITVAPFAVIAPFIGPLLDKIQHGRRIALAATSFGRSLLAIVMAFNFNSWVLYPCALGMMVLSKSFGVLKAALTPRVLPEQITLVKTNSRLTVFGLVAGGVAGGIAAAFAGVTNASGALIWTALCGVAGGVLCLRIPAWVESTEGEVPVQHSEVLTRGRVRRFPPGVSATLWANMANRIETGFLALFIAFVVKTEYSHLSGFQQLLVLGIVGAAAGLGGFVGNALGTQITLTRPDVIAAWGVVAVGVTCLVAIMIPGIAMAAVVGLVGSTSSSLAKVCLDSVIQDRLPEASRASAFGMSESLLQLAWVTGGVVGLLLGGVLHLSGDGVYMLGFAVVTLMVGLGVTQSWLSRSGRALVPALAAAWDRRANRRFAKSRSAGQTSAPRTARFTVPAAGDAEQGPRTQQLPTDEPPATSATRDRRPRKAGRPRR
ncbi:MFS transporter [Nakamurella sp. A5-74]|uniref:MFS transporter n=1 Tax=Nakamurella sp. A5-74 TaxID=3158264 RepID=A0AAU8DLG0_9ACTN